MSMDFLEAVEEQLVAATERGISRRRWRWPWLMRARLPWRAPTIGIAAGIGATLAASAIAATLTLPASHPRAKSTTTTHTPAILSFTTAGAVPHGFQPASFTAITVYNWWLLGTAPCGGRTCTTVVETTDGGSTFTRIPAPPTTAVSNVRFADGSNGYAFGQQLWSTHNGGTSWTQVQVGGVVSELDIAQGYVYAIVVSDGHSRLMRSAVSGDQWSELRGLGHGALSGLWIQGPTVVAQSGDRLFISNDHGNRFARKRGVKNAGDCSFDGGPQALWALCSTGMAPDEVLLSTDSGSTFRTTAQVPNGPLGTFAAVGNTAVVSAQGPLYLTTDAGASWTPVTFSDGPAAGNSASMSANWTYLGFSDATHGVAIGSFGTGGHQYTGLYYTTTGGASYHYVPIGP